MVCAGGILANGCNSQCQTSKVHYTVQQADIRSPRSWLRVLFALFRGHIPSNSPTLIGHQES